MRTATRTMNDLITFTYQVTIYSINNLIMGHG